MDDQLPDFHQSLSENSEVPDKEVEYLRERLKAMEVLLEKQRTTEAALSRSQERLRHALEASRDGIWDVNYKTDEMFFSPRCYSMLGYEYHDFPQTSEAWFAIVHPDDIDSLMATIMGQRVRDFYEIEVRMKTKTGEWHWILWQGKVIGRDEEGNPFHKIGTFTDINRLKQSEEHLKEAQHLAQVGSWMWDVKTDHPIWSEELFHITGRDLALQPPLRLQHKEILTPESWEILEHSLDMAVNTGEPFETELQLIRYDGARRTVLNRAMAVKSADGQIVRLVGSLQDITKRKKEEAQLLAALKEKDILLREIHHRVKGNMQAISSLLNLQLHQSRDTEVKRAIEMIRDRIHSMALVHEKIYADDTISYIDFSSHAQKLISYLILAHGGEHISVELDIDDIKFELDKATPLSLILNELVTNALIHAFPDQRAGIIEIALHRKNREEVILTIHDNGKGFPEDIDIHEEKALGLTLVNAILYELDGTIELDRQNGTTITVRFKLQE